MFLLKILKANIPFYSNNQQIRKQRSNIPKFNAHHSACKIAFLIEKKKFLNQKLITFTEILLVLRFQGWNFGIKHPTQTRH